MILDQLEVRLLRIDGQAVGDAVVTARPKEGGEITQAAHEPSRQLHVFDSLEPGLYEVTVSSHVFAEQKRAVRVHLKPGRTTFVLIEKGAPSIPLGRGRASLEGVSLEGVLETEKALDKANKELLEYLRAAPADDRFLRALSSHPAIYNMGLLLYAAGRSHLTTNQIFVRFVAAARPADIHRVLSAHRLRVVRRLDFAPCLFLVELEAPEEDEVESLSRNLSDDPLVQYAEPCVLGLTALDSPAPNPFLWPGAWDRSRTRVELAWKKLGQGLGCEKAQGDPDVILAMVDLGIPISKGISRHPDFRGTVSSGEPKVHASYDFESMTADIQPFDAHGVYTAGVAAGVSLGVAPNCRILTLLPPLQDQVRRFDALRWAAGLPGDMRRDGFPAPPAPGADLFSISMAFQVGPFQSDAERDLYAFLARRGRQGRGCLFFVAAGNESQEIAISRPTGLFEPVFACAATTPGKDGKEVQADYSGYGDVEWCAPSSTVFSGGDHHPPERYAIWTAALPREEAHPWSPSPEGGGNLPSSPWTGTRLTQAAQPQANTLFVEDSHGFLKGMHLLLERPGHPFLEAVKVAGIGSKSQIIVEKLFYPHDSGTEVFTGLHLTATLVQEAPASSNRLEIQALAYPAPGDLFTPGEMIALWDGSEKDPEIVQVAGVRHGLLTVVGDLLESHAAGTPVYASCQSYTSCFGGTSSATALCSGIASLVLSANPDLTWVEAREILRSTAEKIDPGDASWRTRLSGQNQVPLSFNPKYGYGRLDAAAAVDAALKTRASCLRDLMIRCSPGDRGVHPIASPADSPDIWVSHSNPWTNRKVLPATLDLPAPDQPVRAGQEHWVCARVMNRGTEPSYDAWVRFYVVYAETADEIPVEWKLRNGQGNRGPGDWDPGTYFLEQVGITGVGPGESLVVCVRWPESLLPPPTGPDGKPCDPILLVEITPYDGPLRGTRLGENNNLARKRIQILREPPF